MKTLTGAVLTFLLAAAASAAPPDVQEKVEAKVGQLTRFVVKADKGKKVAFAPAFDEKNCFIDELASASPDQRRFLVQPHQPGEYWVTFWTVGEAEYKQVKIIVPGAVPPPPGPNPNPGPTPPPPDAFSAAVQVAVAAEPAGDRLLVPKLAELYEFGAAQIKAKSGDGQAYLADTWGSLHAAMGAKAADLGVAGKLKLVQAVVGGELAKSFAVKDTDPVTAAQRDKGFAEFARVGLVLREAVK